MKKIALSCAIMACAATASAGTLTCFDAYKKVSDGPYIVANIGSNVEVSNIKFGAAAKENENQIDSADAVEGNSITSNRSPYKGKIQFLLPSTTLILPADYTKAGLIRAGAAQFSPYDKEGSGINGVLIGTYPTGDAGDHYSIRLRCVSDL
jgi:hypothetical protein